MKPRILFFHQSWQGFEKRDFEMLKRNFPTQELLIYKNFLYKIFSVIKKLSKTDIVFCWFAYRSALLPLIIAKMFNKKIIIVVGGWDCANVPEIDYGAMRKGARFLFTRIITKYIVGLADKIIAISEYNKKEIVRNLGAYPDKLTVIYHGIPLDCCSEEQLLEEKTAVVLTVGRVTRETLKRKGLETFIEVARLLPEIKFVLAGRITNEGKICLSSMNIPRNLEMPGFVEESELHRLYRKATVYAQLSYHEQFGCSLMEAMAHGCVPVVTDRAALPEVVGKTGYHVPYGDLTKTANAIKIALKDNQGGNSARKRVTELFPFERREKALAELINGLF